MATSATTALLQAAMRRRLVSRERAMDIGRSLAGATSTGEIDQLLARMSAPEAPMLRQLLPHEDPLLTAPYVRLACLGEGRTASTWLGIDAAGEPVVIKLMHRNRLPPGSDVELFLRDVEPLMNISSRCLVSYRAAFAATDGRAVLVSEYVPGRDLGSRQATKGGLAEDRALPLLAEVARGLAQIEQLGCVHGMLHPGNILLDHDGNARVSDYGLAFGRILHTARRGWDARSLMLQAWSAPEALDTPAQMLTAGDCYSFGCIAYWLLSGKPPFPGTPAQQSEAQANASRPDVRRLAPKVSEITAKTILKAMQVAPAARYHHAAGLVRSLTRNQEHLLQPNRDMVTPPPSVPQAKAEPARTDSDADDEPVRKPRIRAPRPGRRA